MTSRGGISLLLVLVGTSACGGAHGERDAAGDGAAADAREVGAAAGHDGGDGAGGAVDAPDARDGATADSRIDGAIDALGDAIAEASQPASGSPFHALAIATGALHTCAILDDHRVKCWGEGVYGELGLGDDKNRGARASEMGDALPFVDLGAGRTATAISAGRYVTCAILDTGRVKCWGIGGWTGVPADTAAGNRGDAPGEMGDALPALDLGGHKARLLATGYTASCAALDDDSVWCWGEEAPLLPTRVTLGSTSRVVQLSPGGYGIVGRFEDGSVWNIRSAGASPYNLGGARAISVAGAQPATCAVLESGAVACNSNSTSLPPASAPPLVAVGVGENGFSCGLGTGGGVTCWGGSSACAAHLPGMTYWCSGASGSTGGFAVDTGGPVRALATAGRLHACALLDSGAVRCWKMLQSCTVHGADVVCGVPTPDGLNPNVGASVEIRTTAQGNQYGAWRDIDLGKHP